MDQFALAVAVVTLALPVRAQEIRGAGSTAAARLIQEWAKAHQSAAGTPVAYDATGSGEGVRRLKAGQAAFAVSDVALSVPELQTARLVQFPVALVGIVPIANLPGGAASPLRLTGEVLAGIFSGRHVAWNAAEIATLNAGMSLPALPIRIAHRGESSGSTAVFTGYLSRVSAEWKATIGSGTTVTWLASSQACEGSDAMVDFVAKTPGAVGYVDFGRAQARGLAGTRLLNRAKNYVAPSKAAFQHAAAAFPWEQAPGFSVTLLDQPGEGSWPITAPVFVIVPLTAADAGALRRTLAFFDWSLREGEPAAERLGFVAMPQSLVATVRLAWARQFKGPDGKPLLGADD